MSYVCLVDNILVISHLRTDITNITVLMLCRFGLNIKKYGPFFGRLAGGMCRFYPPHIVFASCIVFIGGSTGSFFYIFIRGMWEGVTPYHYVMMFYK
jgi:hypothetical protein